MYPDYHYKKCRICQKEFLFHSEEFVSSRNICRKCNEEIREKEKKTYGWIFYHLLNLEKKWGRIILKGDYSNPNQTKYGLQSIFADRIENKVYFHFYWGRSTRPVLVVPLREIEQHKEIIQKIIKTTKRGWCFPFPDTIEIKDEFNLKKEVE